MRHLSIPSISPRVPPFGSWRQRYLAALDWSFAVFSTMRLLSYMPTMWVIYRSGNSSQHALLTWLVWTAANSVMAASLYERSHRHWNKLIIVTAANAVQCLAMTFLVAWYR
jgi:hypothetical protein